MKLYQSHGPNPRSVLFYLAEKGIDIERQYVDIIVGENREAAFQEINALSELPVLELDDGTHLMESSAICQYLDEIYPENPLIGATPEERAETRMLMRRIDLKVIAPLTVGYRGNEGHNFFKDRVRCLPEASDGLKALTQDGYAQINSGLEGRKWLAGDRFTHADILLFVYVEFGSWWNQTVLPEYKNIHAWRTRMVEEKPNALASADSTFGMPPGDYPTHVKKKS
ncbi:MAG: glutathione S-transferase family protein [Henriciella sp.]